jgi:ABC-2 type transport system ATP-binding protein
MTSVGSTSSSPPFALEARGLSKSFGAIQALREVSFQVRPGSVFGLLGPNGSGKTTLIRIVLDMLRPDRGSIQLDLGVSGPVLDRVSYIPEERGLYQRSEVLKLLTYFGTLKGASARRARAAAEHWLLRLGLAPWAGRRVEELSKGMQQRVQFILALVNEPRLVILDEPFSGLDPLGVRELSAAIAELRRDGTTFILSTHQLNHAESLCDDILLLDRGRTVAAGELAALMRRHAEVIVAVAGRFSHDGVPGVRRVVAAGDRTLLYLDQATNARDFLNAAHERGLTLGDYTVSHATLQDIFLELVAESRSRPEGADGEDA